MDNPITRINENASKIEEEDIDLLVDDLMEYYSSKIHMLAARVYGSGTGVPLAAFKCEVEQKLQKGMRTFLFKSQLWKLGRNIGPYLSSCISNLATSLKNEYQHGKKLSVPICPACRALGAKEFLHYEDKMLRCRVCTRESERLGDQKERSSSEEYEYRIRKVFSLHSRKGYKCPDCNRFIPESLIVGQVRVSCPYDNCTWFGLDSEIELMNHPFDQSSGHTCSLNSGVTGKSKLSSDLLNSGVSESSEFQDLFDIGNIDPDIKMYWGDKFKKDLNIVKEVLSLQKSRLSFQGRANSIKKKLMYRAFEILLEQDPVGMLNYLIYGKPVGERPVQSLIFQKYVQLIENNLPLEVRGEDGLVEVYSLLDPNLGLFLGESKFTSHVRDSGFIPNNTHEVFTGTKCNGPCFIGLLCNLTDENNKSLLSDVEYYTFSTIKMNHNTPRNIIVNVTHYRIPPHYEMYSLVLLQRIRRKIVDSVYKRLYGEDRPIKKGKK